MKGSTAVLSLLAIAPAAAATLATSQPRGRPAVTARAKQARLMNENIPASDSIRW